MPDEAVNGVGLGPFELTGHLGSGGMAEVCAGLHSLQGVDVAVKVISSVQLETPGFVEAFGREVRSIAALDHEAIVSVLDTGHVSFGASAAAGGVLAAGSPYFVMRRASHGTLASLRAPLPWASLPPVLGRLLEGLAHAHARGVIHRDLKPANVLVHREGMDQEVWLSDFGIAHHAAIGGPTDSFDRGAILGTPGFMAPEQLLARWRDYGPWTDLYALGAIAWALLVGREPFDTLGETPQQAIFHRIEAEFPPLPENLAPPEVATWLTRLTARDPAHRYRRAADALADLPGAWSQPLALPLPMEEGGENATTWAIPTPTPHAMASRAWRETTGVGARPAARHSVAPTWRRASRRPAPMKLVGAGLGLYGLRDVPLAGRSRERDALWVALRECAETSQPQLVLLSGSSGLGKSRLAQWLTRRAHEAGVAEVLWAQHESMSARDELAHMVARFLVCEGLPYARAARRVAVELARWGLEGAYEVAAMQSVMAPAFPDGEPPMRFASQPERFEALLSLLRAVAATRPLVLVLDDVQWGGESLHFVQHLLTCGQSLPLLVVGTLQDEALASEPRAAALVEALRQRADVSELRLGALSAEEEERLVRDLLRLEEGLARDVSLHCHGHPQYARQVVGDLVRRGVLVPADEGFRLAPGQPLLLPENLQGAWLARVAAVLPDGTEAQRALWVMACLGRRVELSRWAACCAELGLEPGEDVLPRLELEGLGLREGDAFALAHAQLRDALLAGAERAGELGTIRAACIAVLERDPARDAVLEPLAALLVEDGRLAEAAPLLRQAAQLRVERSEYTWAYALLDRHAAAVDAMAAREGALERARGRALRPRLLRLTGRFREAELEALLAADEARQLGEETLLAEATSRLGEIAMRRGLLNEAEPALREAKTLTHAVADPTFGLIVDWSLAWVALLRGQGELASKAFGETFLAGDPFPALRPKLLHHIWSWAQARLCLLDFEGAEEKAALAEQYAREFDNRLVLAHALQVQASLALLRGERERATDRAEQALAIYEVLGSPESHFARTTLLRSLFERGLGGDLALGVQAGLEEYGEERPMVAARYMGFGVRLALVSGDQPRVEALLRELEAATALTGVVDLFIARDLCLARAEASIPAPCTDGVERMIVAHLAGIPDEAASVARARWSSAPEHLRAARRSRE